MFKVRRGGCEEIPLLQGKEQHLCFAGAALKRYPTSKVREVVKTSCCTPEVRAKRSYHRPEVRGGSREELPHIQGVVAMQAQEGRKELLHVQGQEGRP